jgi:hypothetical protein
MTYTTTIMVMNLCASLLSFQTTNLSITIDFLSQQFQVDLIWYVKVTAERVLSNVCQVSCKDTGPSDP